MDIDDSEPAARAFFSYAHADNERNHGRVLSLAKAIADEFETLTGYPLQVFTDQSKLEWGDDFRQKLDEALEATTFFIPILTPTYFRRDECRREMQTFVSSAKRLGLDRLLLSIRYVTVPDLSEESADGLKKTAASMQYAAWETLRLVDENSEAHRTAVNRLAQRLVDLTAQLEGSAGTQAGALAQVREPESAEDETDRGRLTAAPASELQRPDQHITDSVYDDDAPGTLDLIVDVVPAFEDWSQTVSGITRATNTFSEKFAAATENLPATNSAPNALAQRILAYRRLASEIEPELAAIEDLSREYSAGLRRLDPGVRAIAAAASKDDAGATDARESILGLIASNRDAMRFVSEAADAAKANAKYSRDLRPILRRFETAFRNIVDASSMIADWEAAFDHLS